MINDIIQANGPQPADCGGYLPSVSELVAALSPQQHQHLRHFASRRLRRLTATPWMERVLAGTSPEDLVNRVLEKVLLGENHPKKGRHVKPRSLANTEVFVYALMNIINSELSNLLTSAEASRPHLHLRLGEDDCGGVEVVDAGNPAEALRRRDLHMQLFERLHARAKGDPQMRAVLEAWEANFLTDDRIARGQFDRKLADQAAGWAREILADMAREQEPPLDSAREILF